MAPTLFEHHLRNTSFDVMSPSIHYIIIRIRQSHLKCQLFKYFHLIYRTIFHLHATLKSSKKFKLHYAPKLIIRVRSLIRGANDRVTSIHYCKLNDVSQHTISVQPYIIRVICYYIEKPDHIRAPSLLTPDDYFLYEEWI